MNSFLQLQEEDANKFVRVYQDDVRHHVASRLNTVRLISDIFEHFFPRLSDTVTVMMGGDTIDAEDVYLTVQEADPSGGDTPPRPPGANNDKDITR
jgi:hypothetical protein